MYIDVVHRTQIYLDDEEADLLAEATSRTGASRSELIRRAVRAQYGGRALEQRLAALHGSAGSWHGRAQSGREYVEELRRPLSERLDEVGLG